MPKQSNLEYVREQNAAWLRALKERNMLNLPGSLAAQKAIDEIEALAELVDFDETETPATMGELLRALNKEQAKRARVQAQTEAMQAAPAPKDAIDTAKVLSNALFKAFRSLEGELAFDDPRPEHLADAARHLRSTVEDIVLARRLLLEDEDGIESVLGLSK